MRKELFSITALLAVLPAVGALVPSRVPDGMCEVVLEARDVFGNGTNGFQLLLDADHSTFGEIFFNPGGFFFGDYSAFEYKIPENADPVGATANCVVDGEVSVLIPAGTYDWMTIVPLQEGLSIPNGDYAVGDDFPFEAGNTYRFVAGKRQGQFAEEEFITLVADVDYGVSGLRIPDTGMGLTSAEDIAVSVSNCGTVTVDNVTVAYSVNGGEAVRETLAQPIAPGETLEYVFARKADLSLPEVYNITVTVEAPGDLLPLNNTVSGSCRHLQEVDLPFVYNFAENRDSFDMDWIVIDGNNDQNSWQFNEWINTPSGSMGVAGCPGSFMGDRVSDDWLISQPLNLKKGTAHVLLALRSVLDDTPEKLEVCFGKSPRPEDMTVAASFEFASEQWSKKVAGIDVPEDGVYYVALHGVSESGLNIYVSDIAVGEGEFVGKPDISVVRVVAPYNNCDLPSDGKVGLIIENRGTGDLSGFSIRCNVYAPDNRNFYVSGDFDDVLSPDGKATFMIPEDVDFSAVGDYTLEFRLMGEDVDVETLAMVECFEPYTELPVLTGFSTDNNTGFWTRMDVSGWNYEPAFSDFCATSHGADAGLLSRGMTLQHPVRVKMSYAAFGWGSTVLSVMFGKAGEDPASFTPAFVDDNVTSEPKEVEFEIPVDQAGNYSLVIADTGDAGSSSFLRLNEVLISELLPHDLRIESADGPVAPFMPASHTGRKGVCNVLVANRGSEPMTGVRVQALLDGKPCGASAGDLTIAAGERASVPVEINLPSFEEGSRFVLGMEVSSDVEDGYAADNSWTFPATTVTAQMLSNEDIDAPEYGTGEYGTQLYIGNIYSVAAPSALTSVTIGLCNSDFDEVAKTRIGLNIYIVADGKLGRRILSREFERGKGGFVDVDMQDMLLPAGAYYFEVAQLSTTNMGLAYDGETPAICWQRTGDDLNSVQAYALAVRAMFAGDAKVYSRDAAVTGALSPKQESALFGDAETVVVAVRNAGSEDASFDVELLIDGVSAGKQNVETLFFEDVEVEFGNVDLSRPGAHTLECRVSLAGDENSANDVFNWSIVSAEPLDPYSMDFEGCNDFDADGDRFNPAWTTEDRNGVNTTYFWRYRHRNVGEPCGFMAYNTHATVPSMDEAPTDGFYAFEGDRFGVAFCFNPYAENGADLEQSDVWMVSPLLQLGDDSSFKAYVKTFALESPEAELEPFRMLVSEEAEGYDSFVALGDDIRLAPVDDWGLAEADLSAYDNRKVRVAIQYVGEPIKNTCLMIDNLKVETSVAGVSAVGAVAASLRYDSGKGVVTIGNGESRDNISVYSTDGSLVAAARDAVSVDVSSLPAGVYIARTASCTLKFVK